MKLLYVILQFHKSKVAGELSTFKEFLYDVNNLANSEKKKLDQMLDEMVKKNPADEQEIYEHFSDQYDVYRSKYVELANNGSLVNAYSFFEFQLKDIVRTLDRFVVNKKGTNRHRKRLSYAENLRNDIIAITGLNFSSLRPLWTNLDKYRKIRNVIVHNGANLFEEEGKALVDQKSYRVVSSFTEININGSNGDFYIIDKSLVAKYLDLVEEYLSKLIDILKTLDKADIR
ncbi:MAG TPA: hypothetical protein VD794_11235 [Flavisolibacter sp.]|nr:hypothetical protein [Flavisolibacter sp.]